MKGKTMNPTRRSEMALGRLEQVAHKRFPRYHMALMCCQGGKGHVGVTEKEVGQGILWVSYRDSSAWTFELNGRVIGRSAAIAALGAPKP